MHLLLFSFTGSMFLKSLSSFVFKRGLLLVNKNQNSTQNNSIDFKSILRLHFVEIFEILNDFPPFRQTF